LIEPRALLVADASAVINLNATGCAEAILAALPNRVAVVDVVPSELETGRHRRREDTDRLNALVAAGLVAIVELGDASAAYFEELVVGSAAETLDDGEAATIAYAVEHRAIAIIDERKANRICARRFPQLRLASTVDLFAQADVARALGHERLMHAVLNALQQARMRVLPHHLDWVLALIGPENAAACLSLPRAVRNIRDAAVDHKAR
jgi:predicted nucleic acid-binding protein